MQRHKRVVVKVGTKVITSKERGLDRERIKDIVDQISDIMGKGVEVLLVTSGAIGAGIGLLGLKRKPTELAHLQSAASIGQGHLMHLYGEYFRRRGYLAGQVLLTQDDFDDRKKYLNIKNTIASLLGHKAIPIINENDTVSTNEIKVGDNDRLAQLVSDLSQADMLILLTDVDGLLDEKGDVISLVEEITPEILRLAKSSQCEIGTGGMTSKLEAAKSATLAGIECVVANGTSKGVILKILEGEKTGTAFRKQSVKYIARKRWIAFSSKPKGSILVDDGAREALLNKGRSLLASGITGVEGNFRQGDVIKIIDAGGHEFAKGISGYSASDTGKIKGCKTAQIKSILGYKGRDEVVHKDDMVIL